MLRTYAAPPWVVGSVFPKLGFVQKGELPGHLEGVCSLEVVLPGGMNMASCLISMVSKIYHPKMNCRGFFGLLFSYPFGLFIPRVLDT